MERLLLLEQREVEVESPVGTQCTMHRSPDSRLSQPARTSSQARRLLVFPLSWTVVSLECASSTLHAFRKRQPLFVSTLQVSALDPTLARRQLGLRGGQRYRILFYGLQLMPGS